MLVAGRHVTSSAGELEAAEAEAAGAVADALMGRQRCRHCRAGDHRHHAFADGACCIWALEGSGDIDETLNGLCRCGYRKK